MKINKKQKKNRLSKLKIVVIVVLVAMVMFAYTFIAYAKVFWPFKECAFDPTQTLIPRVWFFEECPNQKNGSPDDNNGSTNNKTDGITPDKTDPEKSPIEQNWTPDDDDLPQTLSVSITSKNIVNGTFRLRVQINKYLSSGTCTLKIGSYSETVAIIPNPQVSSCEGFDVPTSQFSSNDFSVTVRSNDDIGSVEGVVQ